MKRVLIVTPGYYPAKTYGGPVVSIKNLTDALGDELDFYILTSNHELKQKEPIPGLPKGFVKREKAKVCYLSDDEMTEQTSKKILDEINPDCIYINAIYYKRLSLPMIKLAAKRNIRCVIAPRGGLYKNAMQFSKYKKLLYLQYLKRIMGKSICFQSTSEEESEAIRHYFGTNAELVALTNLPKHIDENALKYRTEKKTDEIRVIFFSRIHPIKNLKYALEIVSQITCPCSFDVYGPIEDQAYWSECEQLIAHMPQNAQVQYCGYLENEKLAETLGNYDLFFLPTQSENFGHVIAEALSEKCNILISNNTPWNDVNQYPFGRAIALEKKEAFAAYIQEIAKLSEVEIQNQRNLIPAYLDEHFDFPKLQKEYLGMFQGNYDR